MIEKLNLIEIRSKKSVIFPYGYVRVSNSESQKSSGVGVAEFRTKKQNPKKYLLRDRVWPGILKRVHRRVHLCGCGGAGAGAVWSVEFKSHQVQNSIYIIWV